MNKNILNIGLFINQYTKTRVVPVFMLIMFTSTLIGSISVDSASSQSIEQSSPGAENMTSKSQTIDVVPGKPIQILNNSFIVQLKPVEVGTLADTVGKLTSNITSYDGNVSSQYKNFNSFNIKFEESGNVSELEGADDVSLSGAEQFLQRLKADPRVANVYPDAKVTRQAQILPNDQNRVDADLSAAKSGDGTGTVNANVAILDTGVLQTHPDLNVYKCFSFVNNPTLGTPLNNCNDGDGHGTHVAGTVAAKDNNIGVVGKAPGAKIWAMKVLGDDGSGTFSDIVEALDYVASHADEIDVVNLSLGGEGTYPPVEDAITKLVNNKKVVVVVAAGNSNMDANNFTPARTPAAITVSAISDSNGKCGGGGPATSYGPDDSFATYSNHGSVVDIAAPGTDVYSTFKNSSYTIMSGSATVAANVAGAAALYISMNPSATPDQVDEALKSSGTKAPQSGNGLKPCDQNGKGYFTYRNDDDQFREPLLYMKKLQK
jgi:subtilisin family serine protease